MKAILFVLILALFVISGCIIGGGVSKATATCIASKSTLYVKTGCPYCEEQKELFGENFKYLNVVDCVEEPAICTKAGIIGVPTWVIDDEKIEGVQSIAKLKELTGC